MSTADESQRWVVKCKVCGDVHDVRYSCRHDEKREIQLRTLLSECKEVLEEVEEELCVTAPWRPYHGLRWRVHAALLHIKEKT
jgi:hypothetical protein